MYLPSKKEENVVVQVCTYNLSVSCQEKRLASYQYHICTFVIESVSGPTYLDFTHPQIQSYINDEGTFLNQFSMLLCYVILGEQFRFRF